MKIASFEATSSLENNACPAHHEASKTTKNHLGGSQINLNISIFKNYVIVYSHYNIAKKPHTHVATKMRSNVACRVAWTAEGKGAGRAIVLPPVNLE